jgi:hypothetical protein
MVINIMVNFVKSTDMVTENINLKKVDIFMKVNGERVQ